MQIKNLDEKLEFFKENGYIILEDIYSDKDCNDVVNHAHKVLGSTDDLTPLMKIFLMVYLKEYFFLRNRYLH